MAAWKGSMESDGPEQEHFPVAAQGHVLPRERLAIHICSHHFCFIAPFSELPSQDFCRLFSHPSSYVLTISIPHAMGAVRAGREDERWWLADTKQLTGAARRLSRCPHAGAVADGQDSRVPGQACASTLLVLSGAWARLGHHWGQGEPASFHCSCGCSLLQRGRAEELEAMTFQALQMFAQWM